MKKTILKLLFVAICIAAIVFLLLPFLETTPPVTTDLKSAQPQVDTTDNPLAAIAKRLAALWGKRSREGKRIPSATAVASSQGSLPPDSQTAYAYRPQPPLQQATSSTPQHSPQDPTYQTVSVPPTESEAYGNASVQADNGEWVLIRQTAPQSSKPGMHEVNVHDNPYDRYIRQERALRVSPKQSPAPQAEIPDSKWARLLRPFQALFGGKTEPKQVASVAPVQETEKALLLAAAKDQLSATDRTTPTLTNRRLEIPTITLQQWQNMSEEERQAAKERYATEQFVEMLSGERIARDVAEMMAEAKFPNPKNPEEQQQKENYIRQQTESNKQKIQANVLATMQANAAGKEQTDELAYIGVCKAQSLPSASCGSADETQATRPSTLNPAQQQQRLQNAMAFFEQTKYHFPEGLPITVVLGPTSRQTFDDMTKSTNPAVQQTAEIYTFLYDRRDCDSNTCYGVTNSKQLNEALQMANATSNADPTRTRTTDRDAFIQYKLEQAGQELDAQQQEQIRKAAEQQFDQYAPPFTFATPEQLKPVQRTNLQNTNPNNPQADAKNTSFFYVSDPALAPQFAQDIESVIFGYGQQPLTDSSSPEEASVQITNSLAQNANDAKQAIHKAVEPFYQSTIRNGVLNALQNVKQQIQGKGTTVKQP